ncbi:hypothetical protein Q428_07765 [Fervidicella metallireducens AeB]|uniref:S1 motif domain-containing protein n=1 Tax=Fervidicella metallireducens AeB TaxID=1403537 RepID=A0A017RV42_9CLOT|nr:Rne/Rng family ribonuclease [Fervidicella metallireducens]EYE88471.1 hypothetical protein Q428_07765 [Fervidicella metallireducens AeB]
MKEVYIDAGITQNRALVINDGRVTDLIIENNDNYNITGNIYFGRVENIVPALNAAFINIGTSKNAILDLNECLDNKNIKRGQGILVQVVREGVKEKGPKVTTNISIPGKTVVLLPFEKGIFISNKIEKTSKTEELKKEVKIMLRNEFGVILRTEAFHESTEMIENEIEELRNFWNKIKNNIQFIKPPLMIFNSKDFYSYVLREIIKSDVERIYVNRHDVCEYIKQEISGKKTEKVDKTKSVIYDINIFDKIEKTIMNSLNDKITLTSGGFLVIDETEACVVIDVNSGNYICGSNIDETILKTNIEAIDEIYNAVTLRNYSGIIIIDFINMMDEKHKEKVLEEIKMRFKEDKIKNDIYGFTSLGLLEMSRAKKGQSLAGFIYKKTDRQRLTTAYILKLIENECVKRSKFYNIREFNIEISPETYEEFLSKYQFFIQGMKDNYDINVIVKKSNVVRNYRIASLDTKKDFVKVEFEDKRIFGEIIDFSFNSDADEIIFKIKSNNKLTKTLDL